MSLKKGQDSRVSFTSVLGSGKSESFLKMPSGMCSALSLNTNMGNIMKTKVITRDLIRDMVIPRKEPPGLVAIVTPNRIMKIKQDAQIVSKQEKEAIVQQLKDEKEKLREASKIRRSKMEELDLARKKNVKLTDLEEAAKKETEYLCAKANETRQEQEEEIKEINELILCSKVQAIRDDQIAQKQMIKQQCKKAETELDVMMEKKRVEGLKEEEEKAKRRKEVAYEAATLLQEQIQGNFENRLLEKERVDQEGEAMKRYFEKLQLEDIEEMKQQKAQQKLLLETLLKENAEIAKQKEYKKEQSKQEDIMIAAYQKQKAAQEEAAEAELKERKRQRELEIAKMREQQEKASNIQAEKDALRARRAQEQKERDYRRKVKEDTLKNKQIQENLQKYRTEQLENQNRLTLLKAQEEQKAFQAMIEKNKHEMEKEEQRRMMKRLENLHHSHELRKQIQEREKQKINEKRDFFLEGIHKNQEEKLRKQRLDALRMKKLNELKNYDIPPQYLSHIQRKTNMKLE